MQSQQRKPDTLSQLARISEAIGDIHSQFDTQGLFNPKNYLQFLDDEKILALLRNTENASRNIRMRKAGIGILSGKQREDNERLDFLQIPAQRTWNASIERGGRRRPESEGSHYLNNFGTVSENLRAVHSLYEENDLPGKNL